MNICNLTTPHPKVTGLPSPQTPIGFCAESRNTPQNAPRILAAYRSASRGLSLGLFLGLFLGLAHPTLAQMPHESLPVSPGSMASDGVSTTVESRRVEQPLWVRISVTVGGLGLIGLELGWFLDSRPKSRQVSVIGDE